MQEPRAIIDLSGRQLFHLLMSLLVDTGYGNEDGNLTVLGEEYLLTIQLEEEAKTFDVALTTVHNLSAPEPGQNNLDEMGEFAEADHDAH